MEESDAHRLQFTRGCETICMVQVVGRETDAAF
jgi:hypothetical protein